MACNWMTDDYFAQLICPDRRSHTALEMLVDDLHTEKERTITTFLCHSGSEDFLWGLVKLLGNDTARVAGNAAYIIGTLAESELGCYRILSLAKGRHAESRKILVDLTRMLTFDDPESVMNAAGTMGTLAESPEGRDWMLSEPSIEAMVDHVTLLLHVDNLWTASNAALVLARLCISEDGCNSILKHSHSHNILTRLVLALGVDEAEPYPCNGHYSSRCAKRERRKRQSAVRRGMNAAFAIGRLCDMDTGRHRLLSLPDSEKMISALAKMLSCEDTGASKNACFALSCLATNLEGHGRLLNNSNSEEVLKTLCHLLSAEDCETGWFAAMTLRTLASQPKGCLRLREFSQVVNSLKKVEQMSNVNSDLKEEVTITLEILKRLDPPDSLSVSVLGSDICHASWNQVTTKSGFDVRYQLFEGSKCLYNGPNCQCEIPNLNPYTTYRFRVRAATDGDDSAFSPETVVTTEENLPEAPQNFRILGVTITQLKVGWDPPHNLNGVSKGYYVYQGKTMVEHTHELSSIISGLSAHTSYDLQVCAGTSKGKGSRATCTGTTAELGAHAPSKPHVQVLGRNEVHVAWEPPEVPMGRITRYDVSMNGKIIYSGTDLSCGMRRLTPDTEYSFVVTALTNEGKFESKVTKKRTSKDEFDPDRPPLYQPPKKEEEPPKVQKKRKSLGDVKSSRSNSAKGSLSHTPERPVSASSGYSSHPNHNHESPRNDREKDEEPTNPSPAPKARTLNKAFDTKKENVRPRTHKESTFLSSSSRSMPSASTLKDSHHLFPRQHTRIDKPSSHSKPSFPVSVSYVSIQGGDDQNLELDAIGPDFMQKRHFIRSPTVHESNFSTLRIDRSRTTLLPSKSHSTKHRLGDSHQHHPHHLNNHHLHQQHHPSSVSVEYSRNSLSGGSRHSLNSQETRLSLTGNGDINGKTAWLPKPAMPSPDYLEGHRGLTTTSPDLARSALSPRVNTDSAQSHQEGDEDILNSNLNFLKRKEEESQNAPLFFTRIRTPVDAYFIEAQQNFMQRTNTFVNSHRPGLRKAVQVSNTAPVHLMGSASLQLPEHRHNQQRSHNKFIPMQLRTQPTNLTTSQLQRMNTTLTEPNRGLPGRRLEALTRSQTQVSFKSSSNQFPNNRSSLDMELMGVTTQGLVGGSAKQERIQPKV